MFSSASLPVKWQNPDRGKMGSPLFIGSGMGAAADDARAHPDILTEELMITFCSLFTSSSGNCTYLSYRGGGILIDAGVSAKRICQALQEIGGDIRQIEAVFVTHEHADHVKGIPVLCSKYQIPVFANAATLKAIAGIGRLDEELIHPMAVGATCRAGEFAVTSFATPHDSVHSVGYNIVAGDRKISVVTDLGYFAPEVAAAVRDADFLMIESNHDEDMLRHGRYPAYLKARILSDTGHLSNGNCAHAVKSMAVNGTRAFVLAHMSKENNSPAAALTAVDMALSGWKPNWQGEVDVELPPGDSPGRVHIIPAHVPAKAAAPAQAVGTKSR